MIFIQRTQFKRADLVDYKCCYEATRTILGGAGIYQTFPQKFISGFSMRSQVVTEFIFTLIDCVQALSGCVLYEHIGDRCHHIQTTAATFVSLQCPLASCRFGSTFTTDRLSTRDRPAPSIPTELPANSTAAALLNTKETNKAPTRLIQTAIAFHTAETKYFESSQLPSPAQPS